MAETRKDAESAFDFFLEAYGPKYDKAAACLAKDRDVLLTFSTSPPSTMYARPTPTFATVRPIEGLPVAQDGEMVFLRENSAKFPESMISPYTTFESAHVCHIFCREI